MEAEKELKDIISMLKEKKALLSKISDLTYSQKESLSQGDVDRLTSIIDEKDAIIKHTVEVDECFKNAYDSLKAELGVDSLEKSELLSRELLIEMKECTKEVLNMIHDITEVDNDNRKNAMIFKDKLAEQIKKINNTKYATNAYLGKPQVFQNSYYFDRKK